jgi:Glycosyl transferase family 2
VPIVAVMAVVGETVTPWVDTVADDPVADAPGVSPAVEIAVVMVVRDQLAVTLRALVGLARGDQGAPFQTVVVDDASSDATPALFRGIEGNFTGLREDTACGFAAGCDRAVAACRANLIVVMREDLVPTTGWLEPLRAAFDDLSTGVVLPRVIDVGGQSVTSPAPPCLAIRREALAAIGGFQGAAQPSRAIKLTVLEAVEASGWKVRDVPLSVLLSLPDTVAAG